MWCLDNSMEDFATKKITSRVVMRKKSFDSINVVPFIDIMLVLLVIVLTTASFIHMHKKDLKISIDKDGVIFFDSVEIPREKLEETLLTHDTKTPIQLYCDKDAKYLNFVYLLNILKKNNYENLGIITKNE